MAWNGARCVLVVPGQPLLQPAGSGPATTGGGPAATPEGAPDRGFGGAARLVRAEPPSVDQDPAKMPVVRSRTPEHDEDCIRNYYTTRVAYRFSGSTFQGRNPAIDAAGCVRRDMGESWTSACCPE
jgi:hypothetical protein